MLGAGEYACLLACLSGGFAGAWWPAAKPREEWGEGGSFRGSAMGHKTLA